MIGHEETELPFEFSVEFVDQQHRDLLAIVAELERQLLEGSGRTEWEAVRPLLDLLIEEASHHFATEETYMESLGFPYIETHRYLHKQLLNTAREIRLTHETQQSPVTLELGKILSLWLTTHMDHEDRKILEYLESIGKNDETRNLNR